MNRHIRELHTASLVFCDQCDFSSLRKDNMKRHTNTMHGAQVGETNAKV